MAKTQEKITCNFNIVELAKVDCLIENGFYSNRSDFMRAALRNQLLNYEVIISATAPAGSINSNLKDMIR